MKVSPLQSLRYFVEPLAANRNAEPVGGLEYLHKTDEIILQAPSQKICHCRFNSDMAQENVEFFHWQIISTPGIDLSALKVERLTARLCRVRARWFRRRAGRRLGSGRRTSIWW